MTRGFRMTELENELKKENKDNDTNKSKKQS